MSSIGNGRHAQCNDIRLHYIEYPNDLPPLLILPGITMPAATWGFVAERLAAFAHVYVLDNRGRGLSEGGPHLGYTLDDYARDGLELIRHLGLIRPNVVGHSMGARIAVRMAATAPDLIGKLILADPPVTGPGRKPYPAPLSGYLKAIAQTSAGEGVEEIRSSTGWSDENVNLRMQWLPTCDPHAVAESYRSFHEEDIHSNLASFPNKTLLMYAERGGTVSDEEAHEFTGMLQYGSKVRIAGAGHMIPWDDLETFAMTVQNFLARD